MPIYETALLSTSYLPPIQYVSKFLLHSEIIIEKHENYQKQSYRNRCYIYGANGPQCLVIPVKKQHGEKTPISEVEIDYSVNWQKIHLKSMDSAYRLSAFYEFYRDELKDPYTRKIPFLFNWNMEILKTVLLILGIEKEPAETGFWECKPIHGHDFRQYINPKKRLAKPDRHFNPVPYQQVFRERYGFIPNLSIIDLLFNEGPESIPVLRKSIS